MVLADGFYGRKREGKTKQTYYIRLKDGRLFAFAGLWERWEKQELALETCTLIITGPNALMEPIHNRMFVILMESEYGSCLGSTLKDTIYLIMLLEPYLPNDMKAYPNTKLVNNPRNDFPQCIRPLESKFIFILLSKFCMFAPSGGLGVMRFIIKFFQPGGNFVVT